MGDIDRYQSKAASKSIGKTEQEILVIGIYCADNPEPSRDGQVATRIIEERQGDFGMPLVGSFFPADFAEKAGEEIGKALLAFVEENITPETNAQAHVAQGPIYKEIISAADRLGCDVIVMASHRPSTKDYLLGPNASRVVRHAKQSVFIVRE